MNPLFNLAELRCLVCNRLVESWSGWVIHFGLDHPELWQMACLAGEFYFDVNYEDIQRVELSESRIRSYERAMRNSPKETKLYPWG